jgi:hypothetical protein
MRATKAQLEARDATIGWLNRQLAARDESINDLIRINQAHRLFESDILLAGQFPTDADKDSWPWRIREMRAKCDQYDAQEGQIERLRSAINDLCPALVGETHEQTLRRTIRELREEREKYASLYPEVGRLQEALGQIYAASREYAMYDVFRGFDRMSAIAAEALRRSDVPDQS